MTGSVKGAIAALAAMSAAYACAQQIQVQVDGSPVQFRYGQPQYINGRVLVPLRGVFEQMGATVDWNPSTRMVTAHRGGSDVELRIGDRNATVNGTNMTLDVPAMIIGSSTMVPIRFVSEALGAQVGWMEADHLVSINTMGSGNGAAVVQQPPQRLRRFLIPANTNISATLDRGLGTWRTIRGQAFSATVDNAALGNRVSIPDGAHLEGHVASVRADRYGGAMIELTVDRLRMPNGRTIPITGWVASIDNGRLVRDGRGMFAADRNFQLPRGTEITVHVRRAVTR